MARHPNGVVPLGLRAGAGREGGAIRTHIHHSFMIQLREGGGQAGRTSEGVARGGWAGRASTAAAAAGRPLAQTLP